MAKKSNSRSEDAQIKDVVVAFAQNLFEAREDKWGNKSYQCTLLIPKTNTAGKAVLEGLCLEAATKEWGEKAVNLIKNKGIKSPFLDGDGEQGTYLDDATGERKPKPGFAGHWFLRVKSGEKFKPKVFDRKVLPIVEAADLPSGSRGNAVVNAFTWENDEQGKGLTFGISMFQATRIAQGDEVLGGTGGGGADPEKYFEKIADEGDAPASTKTGEGAAGLFE